MSKLWIEQKKIHNEQKAQPFNVMLKVFPELKESEDERIRKRLILFLEQEISQCSIQEHADKLKQFIAWLEKQGESYTKRDVDDAYIKGICDAKHEYENQGEQKPAEWSEEDEKILDGVITNYESGYLPSVEKRDEIIEKLKSLRPQSQWKPSDEQMDALRYVTNFDYGGHKTTLVSLYEQLKKLREE